MMYFHLQQPIDIQSKYFNGGDGIPFAVIFHCYYTDSLLAMLKYFKNIPRRAHIFVSTDTKEKALIIEGLIRPLQFKRLEIRIFPNRGWDIAPFLIGFHDVFQNFEFLLKIHAKKSSQFSDTLATEWREILCETLMPSSCVINQILGYFNAHKKLGMIAPPTWEVLTSVQGINHTYMKKILQTKDVHLPHDAAIDFPAGSMFWCRTKALKPWLDMKLSFEDFDEHTSSRDGTLAHAFERLFFWGCGFESLYWGRMAPRGVGLASCTQVQD